MRSRRAPLCMASLALSLVACGPERPSPEPLTGPTAETPSFAESAKRAGQRLVDARDATQAVAAAVLDDPRGDAASADPRGKRPD